MFTRREISILIVLCCINFCLTVDFMILMPLGPQLMRLLQISPKQFSQLVAVYTMSAGLAGILSSLFLDRIDRKKALLFFLGGFALGNVASATASEFELLLAARAWTGLFVGFTGATMYASLSDSIAVEKRATAMGIVLSTFALASIFGIPFGLYLAKQFDWHAPFYFVLSAVLATMATALAKLSPMTEHLLQSRWTLRDSAAQLRFVVGHKSRVTALIFMFFLIMGHFSLIPFLFPSVVANGGISESDLPLVYIAGGLASIISSVVFGRLADLFGKKRVFAVCLL
ncbi:MAG TPA: MFS transporter, partial [Bdellovibrionales bacterium]|nr:MFS transporter [Bdellovibrionales bacterium]